MKKYLLPLGILTLFLVCAPSQGDELDNKVQANEQLGLTGDPNPAHTPFTCDFISPDPKPEVRPEPQIQAASGANDLDHLLGLISAEQIKDTEEAWRSELSVGNYDFGAFYSNEGALNNMVNEIVSSDAAAAGNEAVPEVGDLGGPVQEIL